MVCCQLEEKGHPFEEGRVMEEEAERAYRAKREQMLRQELVDRVASIEEQLCREDEAHKREQQAALVITPTLAHPIGTHYLAHQRPSLSQTFKHVICH